MTSAQRLLKKFILAVFNFSVWLAVRLIKILLLITFYFSQSFVTKNGSDILFANSSGFQELPFNGGQVDPVLAWPCPGWPEDQLVT